MKDNILEQQIFEVHSLTRKDVGNGDGGEIADIVNISKNNAAGSFGGVPSLFSYRTFLWITLLNNIIINRTQTNP